MYCIAGADGFLGAYLQRELLRRGETVVALYHTAPVFPDGDDLYNLPFELADRADMDAAEALLRRFGDIRVFYTIAVHAPDKVEAEPAFAHHVNHVLYADFLRKLSGCDITQLYYASTDNVYGESRDGKVFTEEDAPAPINAYGEQKAEAERITREQGFSVARFSYMFAPSLTYKPHFFDVITQKLKAGQPVDMFTDFTRSSLTYPTAADCLIRLTEANAKERVFNICADEPTSKYDIGLFAAEYCGADRSLVVPARGLDRGLFTAARAPSIVMSNARLKRAIGDDSPIPSFAIS